MQIVLQIFKNTTSNSQNLAISSEKFHFLCGGVYLPLHKTPSPIEPWTTPIVPNEAFWIRQCVLQNSNQIYAYARHTLTETYYYKNSSGDEIANVNFCTTTTYM